MGLYGERSHRCEFAMGEFAIGIGIEKKILFDWHKDHGGISQAKCREGVMWVSWAQADAREQEEAGGLEFLSGSNER